MSVTIFGVSRPPADRGSAGLARMASGLRFNGYHRSAFCEPALNPHANNPMTADTQINWLELARFAAVGQGHQDLGRGVQRLATLAAAVHRRVAAQPTAIVKTETEKDTPRVHGRTPQAAPAPGMGNLDGNGIAITEDAR